MRDAHTVEQVRAAESDLMERLPEGALMQRAATGLAHEIARFLTECAGGTYGRQVLLLVGSGDNGGDALFAGAWLARRGVGVEALLLSPDKAHAQGLAALRAAGGRVTEQAAATRTPHVLVDGIVGIGATGGLREDARAVVAGVRERHGGLPPVVAVDLPSGLGVDEGTVPRHDDGSPDPAAVLDADLTVTFGTHKTCHLVEPAASRCGQVRLVDIGLETPAAPVTALGRDDVRRLLPRAGRHDQKYGRGVIGVRTGSAEFPGAAVLSVGGASCGLAGMVRYVGGARDEVNRDHPEVVGAGRVQAWTVGSGGGADAAQALEEARGDEVPLCIDADALAHLDGPPGVPAVLTPHAGELAALLGVERAEVEAEPLAHARRAAETFDCTVLLKGPRTLVARPDGAVRVNTTGTPWLATAGSGDVLAGLVGALLAAGLDPFDAGSVGAWVHGRAAEISRRRSPAGPLVAGDLVPGIRTVLRRLA
ncbi:bifunctional ADP-dependent NAD(P)H-hydrate dehydratase/NAD(P)H-hydrate epimerase [Nocardioidaceae bacterium]|nr:bifunctional ADP-dependent NAD(P)H-hydrate dehydratase/NAD(P)H-hydrate epimerase [Nocardioidaceae bacterium]